MLSPAYEIILGDRRIDTTEEPKASTAETLTVNLDLDSPADSATITFGKSRLDPEQGQQAAVRLGYLGQALVRVLVGRVVDVAHDLWGMRVVAHAPGQRLLDSFVDRTFENKTAGDIARELAEAADVTVGRVEPGTRFPAYVVDGRRSVYHHLRDLADLSGLLLLFDAEGAMDFRAYRHGGNLHTFTYGENIVALDVEQADDRAGLVEAWGESPGTSRGSESWAWLTRDFTNARGSAGEGAVKVLLERPALRTHDAAQRAAEALADRLTHAAVRGRLRTLGRPEVRPADALRIKDAPGARLDGDYQIRAVGHRISKAAGFLTDVHFVGAA